MQVEFLSSDPQPKLIESYVLAETPNASQASTALNTLLIRLSKKETTLLSIVKDLHLYLTSTNQTHRTKGCLLLSNIFERCQNLSLDSQEFISLYEFFISKMTDVAATLEAVKVIHNLLVRNSKGNKIFGDEKKLFDMFISKLESKAFHTPAYSQEVRYYVYQIIKHFTQYNEQYCLEMNDKFLRIVLNAIEEEQDPRNLMVSFKLIHFLLEKIPSKTLDLYLKDIFEALSMYYPISFTPPENDIYRIMPQDLEDELNICLCHATLVDLTMELVFEKLSASQDSAKISCLKTLEQLVRENFSRGFIAKYGEDIWSRVKLVYYHGISAELEKECLNFLQKLFSQPLNLSFDKGLSYGVLDNITEKIITGCFGEIQKGSATQNANKSVKLLALLSTTSEDLSTTILNRFCSLFIDKCEIQKQNECQAWLEFLFKLYDAWSKVVQGKPDPTGNLYGLKLPTFKLAYQRLKDILDSYLSTEASRIIALKIYAQATSLLYKSVEYHAGYGDLCKMIEVTNQTPIMKECVADALVIASEGNQIAEVDETISRVIDIFEKVFCKGEICSEGTLEAYFEHNQEAMFYVLKTFSSKTNFRKRILTLLLQFLNKHLQTVKASEYLLGGVKTLKQIIITMHEDVKKNSKPEDFENIQNEIFDLLVANVNLEKGLLQIKQIDKARYTVLKTDFRNIVSELCSSNGFVKRSFAYLTQVLHHDDLVSSHELKIIGWLFEAMHQKEFTGDSKEAFTALISVLQTKNIGHKAAASLGRLVRCFINKTNDNATSIQLLGSLSKSYKESNDINKLLLYSYAIKGVIIKGDMAGFQCLVQFFNLTLPLIQEPKHPETLISCYKVIIKDLKREFSEFVISATFKQRLFSMIFPYSFTLYEKGKQENVPLVKEFFTMVIMYLITQTPFKIMKSNFQKILPIILENIAKLKENFEKQLDYLEYSIEFISKILMENEEPSDKVEDLVEHLLYIVRVLREKQNSVSAEYYVRNYSTILKTLIKISKMPLKNVKKLNNEVIETLSIDKDNRKRDIRKYIARCINEWSIV